MLPFCVMVSSILAVFLSGNMGQLADMPLPLIIRYLSSVVASLGRNLARFHSIGKGPSKTTDGKGN